MLCEIVECDLALHDPQLAELILGLSQSFLRKARTQLAKAAELWQPRSAHLREEIRHAFPLTRTVVQGHPLEKEEEAAIEVAHQAVEQQKASQAADPTKDEQTSEASV
jgi:hypothetical protein